MNIHYARLQNLGSLVEDQERERERREVAHRVQQFTSTLEQYVFVLKL